MSMNELFGMGGGKPKLITKITSGTGTYIPTENNARCFIRRQGAGGGGGAGGASATFEGGGGGAGAQVDSFEIVPIAGITYAIGAKGVGVLNTAGTAGSRTRCGNIIAPGGLGGDTVSGSTLGGAGGYLFSADTATGNFGLLSGVSGGAGGSSVGSSGGFSSGFSKPVTNLGNGQSTGASGAGGGGDSAMGKGGNGVNGGNGIAATGFGAGGGGAKGIGTTGGQGSDGCVEIWDFGA